MNSLHTSNKTHTVEAKADKEVYSQEDFDAACRASFQAGKREGIEESSQAIQDAQANEAQAVEAAQAAQDDAAEAIRAARVEAAREVMAVQAHAAQAIHDAQTQAQTQAQERDRAEVNEEEGLGVSDKQIECIRFGIQVLLVVLFRNRTLEVGTAISGGVGVYSLWQRWMSPSKKFPPWEFPVFSVVSGCVAAYSIMAAIGILPAWNHGFEGHSDAQVY
jgi:hypothetical protein